MMKKYGYVFKNTDDGQELFEEYQTLIDFGCQQVKISARDLTTAVTIKELFPDIKQGDQIVFSSITGLGKTVKELFVFLELINEQGFLAYFIQDDVLTSKILDKNLEETIGFVLSIQREVLKVKKEVAETRDQVIGDVGRPRINSEQVEQIIYHYLYEKMSYREISQATELSIGTVHKYVNLHKASLENG